MLRLADRFTERHIGMTPKMRNSMFLNEYLDYVAKVGPVAISMFLGSRLNRSQRPYAGKYASQLRKALRDRVETGEVMPVLTYDGSEAFIRKDDYKRKEWI